MEGHTVAYSQSTIIELMVPSYANFGGKVHGGTLMSLMDKVAYVCASKHAGNYCVTVSVDNVEFLQPVEVGEVIKLMGSVNYVGRTSLVVGIKVVAENLQEGVSKHTNTCYFNMVAKSPDGKTAEVPALIPAFTFRCTLRKFQITSCPSAVARRCPCLPTHDRKCQSVYESSEV